MALAVGFSALGIIPVRAYVGQRARIASADERLSVLNIENQKLATRAALLKSEGEIERIARRQFGMVREGEQAYAVPGLRSDDPFSGDELVPALPAPKAGKEAGFLRQLLIMANEWLS